MAKGLEGCKCIDYKDKDILLTLLKKETKFIKDSFVILPMHDIKIYQEQVAKLEDLYRKINEIDIC